MGGPRTKIWLAVGIPVALLALLIAGWAIDVGVSGGRVIRNTELAGRTIGGRSESGLVPAVVDLAGDYEGAAVRIRTPDGTLESTAGELGLTLDTEATADAALEVGREHALPRRFFHWVGSFITPSSAPLNFTVDETALAAELVDLQGDARIQPQEPMLVGSPSVVGVRGGEPGTEIDPTALVTDLLEAAESGDLPVVVDAEAVDSPPRFTDEQAHQLAGVANDLTTQPLEIRAGDQVTTVPPESLRTWITSAPGADGLILAIDETKAIEDLALALPGAQRSATDASFDLVDGAPVIRPSVTGTACCADGTGQALLEALTTSSPTAEIELRETEPELTTGEAEALGIREKVGAQGEFAGRPFDRDFTTYHAAGEGRVTNIHRMADIVRGAVIMPGETFSLNGHVGRRTREGGFVPGGFIQDGVLVQDIGGGVSQFATTLFNTAFFAGLDYGEYQSHSLVIGRYPYGREATVSFPNPDLQIENTTPYGVLIWTSYTESSITVTFYSTPYAVGAQTGQSRSRVGPCTSVTTERTRTYVDDGRTETDTVRALYRPGEGVDC
ncbi:VanW family protein [soil metagenome]